ncbi:MAG TPA: serine hydrolase domain-containing protein [Chthonomonadales bacterium]|nr:serine hydrolase domain-containing protein [Chthonomonadales bacterium]
MPSIGHSIRPRALDIADRLLAEAAADGVCGAATLCISVRGRIEHAFAVGQTAPGVPASIDTPFDVASLTKPYTAAALLALVEDGVLSLRDPVRAAFPEAPPTALANATFHHLATHTSGLPAWLPLYESRRGAEAFVQSILRTPLASAPGAAYLYSDLGYVLLGAAVARAAREPLEAYLRRRLLAPLGLDRTTYLPPEDERAGIAPTAHCPMRPGATLRGEVHDANAHAMGGIAGHAGLFGSAQDVAAFGAAMLGHAPPGCEPVLGEATLRLARRSQIGAELGGHSIGWFTPPNPMLPCGDLWKGGVFGHTGFTGTLLSCWEEAGLAVALLTNRVLMPEGNDGVMRLRRRVLNAVAGGLATVER